MRPRLLPLLFLLFCTVSTLIAQTTGKITGKVVGQRGVELPGVNVIVEGQPLGAISDPNGEFFIINIKPGTYTLVLRMIGYETVLYKNVTVSVNRTANLGEITMKEAVIAGEAVTVTAEKISVKKDQTSSIRNVSADQITSLPVEAIDQVIELQAGVVQGHFRGGRSTEVSYLIDGMQVDEAFAKENKTVQLETEAVQDLEVITGTFNAEYGRAMSGIVNMVTKDGRGELHGSASANLSSYPTAHSTIFPGLEAADLRNKDYKVQLEGPVWRDKITFFANIRYQDRQNYLNGIRRFNVDDFTEFDVPEYATSLPTRWDAEVKGLRYYSEHTGDGASVPMDVSTSLSFMGKLSFNLIKSLKLSAMTTLNQDEAQYYDHYYKYKPDGRASNHENTRMYMVQFNHFLSQRAFQDLKISHTRNQAGSYLYKDPFDPRYVSNNYSRSAAGFATGGQDKGVYERWLETTNAKYDLTWQINKQHSLKTGFLATGYKLTSQPTAVRDRKYGTPEEYAFVYDTTRQKIQFLPYEAEILPDSALAMDRYTKKPYEFSAYLQDKMEFSSLVVNLGIRFDYFNSNTTYPSQLRNPANQLQFPDNQERMSTYPKASAQTQVSPRFGLSYTLGKAAVLHFSYGHFFQMSPLYALYQNSRFMIPPGNFATIHGNPNISAEKTVQYEMGLWQELMAGLGLDVSVFYRDIYDLQSAIVVTTYNQIKYGLYSNKDYGNVKGMELKLDYAAGPLSIMGNYTLQYTRGNADNPASTFSRAGSSLDPIPRLIPLAWDQRHTFNLSLGYTARRWNVNLTGYYNSGLPYTFAPISESPLSNQTLYPNNSKRPANWSVDLKGNYDIPLAGARKLRLFLSVYNLFDTLNELSVNSTTGRAYTAIIRPTQLSTFRSNWNTIYDAIENPAMYSAPREVKLGLGFLF